MNMLQQELDTTKEALLSYEIKQGTNLATIEHYKDADRFYIDKILETIPLLQPEVEALKKLISQSTFIDSNEVTARLNFLETKNKLIFSEGVVQSNPYFKETLESLVNPVEVNEQDIQNILSKVEGIPIGPYRPGPDSPQLIITDFKIDKKRTNEENEVYQLQLKFIQREYNQ